VMQYPNFIGRNIKSNNHLSKRSRHCIRRERGGDDTITSLTHCLRTEKKHPSTSSGKLAKASKQHVKGEGQRVIPPGRQHN
jgi:hypothetical protein